MKQFFLPFWLRTQIVVCRVAYFHVSYSDSRSPAQATARRSTASNFEIAASRVNLRSKLNILR